MEDDVFEYDFGGYVTKNDLQCSDGRIIRHNAFEECSGMVVPLVFQHCHNDINNVLGKVLLENRDDGVYGYGAFNDTSSGATAKSMVAHGDIDSLSIYANKLVQDGPNVLHGTIREVSLVLSGANPGARIDNISFAHADGYVEDSDEDAIIYSGESFSETYLYHADDDDDDDVNEPDDDDEADDDDDKTVGDVFDTFSEKQKNAVYALIDMMMSDSEESSSSEVKHAESDDDETVEDVFNTLDEEQQAAAIQIIAEYLDAHKPSGDDAAEHDGLENDMHKNVFDANIDQTETLVHANFGELMANAKARGSFRVAFDELSDDVRDAFIQHDTYTGGDGKTYTTKAYGISNIGLLFPEAQTIDNEPGFISRPMEWVPKVLNAVRHSPFSRIRSVEADITADAARAKGYVTGAQKVEEVISLLKRETGPTTVYKKQKFDRDDITDITDFDVVRWIRGEMRVMLDEEIARAILIGDGRTSLDPDKIKEDCIRPIWTDDSLYTIHVTLNAGTDIEDAMDQVVVAQDDYRGSGSPVMFIAPNMLTQMLLLKDEFGHRLYKTEAEVASALGVSSIVRVPLFKNLTRTVTGTGGFTAKLFGIVVNLRDYNVGTDKGGQITAFDDFDIDYNQLKYLIETRMSGALIKPYSAIAVEIKTA